MGKKKMKLPFLFKSNSIQASSSWPWPPCQQPRTLSFRADETPSEPGDDPVETVIQGLVRSERLFFEPGETSSILQEAKPITSDEILPLKKSVVLSMESRDPFADFRNSMEEMVEANGLKGWEKLEELLCWYLKANGKAIHGCIVAAFVDLLVELASINSSTDNDCIRSRSPSSPLSFCTSASSSSSSCSSSSSSSSATTPCVSSLSDQKITEDDKDDDVSSSLSHSV
ncbi:transcription repressor OFP15-like [Hibiscus syriacus]|uniref:transcription repressor OFP15-like n=1 Tax=Hibiscus syriacus TaxID=106335 RepID=UPI0019204C36|nr:transcription repressor OFP15-like [Hibiscus syriacus]